MSRIFNRYSNQLANIFGRLRIWLTCISLAFCFTPLFAYSQSLPVVDNSNDLLGLSPISINNYVQCTIKYLQSSSNLVKLAQEKTNKISFYQKSLKDLIEIYHKLYSSNQLSEAQELIQEIQKIRIYSGRLSKSLEIGITLNKQIIRETQKKPCNINSLQSTETSQINITTQSNGLETQLNSNLEKAYTLISQTQFRKSEQLISDLNSSNKDTSSSVESSSMSSVSSSVSSEPKPILEGPIIVSPIVSIPSKSILPTTQIPIDLVPNTNNIQSSSSQSVSQNSSQTSSSSVSSSTPQTSSSSVSVSSQSSSSSQSSGANISIINHSSSSSDLVGDDDLINLANDKSIPKSN